MYGGIVHAMCVCGQAVGLYTIYTGSLESTWTWSVPENISAGWMCVCVCVFLSLHTIIIMLFIHNFVS